MVLKLQVLLVDDEPGFLEQAEIFLEKEDDRLDVETASSGEKALEMLNSSEYDAVVSDYQMPGMDGLEFLKIVREDRESDVPFIIFTGKGRGEVAIEALNLGADRYLQKGGSPKSQYGVLANAIVQEVKRLKAELEMEKMEAEFSSLTKGSDDPIYIVDEDCRIVFANQAELEKTGMEQDEIIGSKFRESHPGKDAKAFEKKVGEALKTEEPQRQEVKHEQTEKYYDRTLSPIKNLRTGKTEGVAVISKDVTERRARERKIRKRKRKGEVKLKMSESKSDERLWLKRSNKGDIEEVMTGSERDKEEEVRKGEEKFKELFEMVSDPAYLMGKDGTFQEVNEAFTQKSGYDREEIVGKSLESPIPFISEENRQKIVENFKKRLKGEDISPYPLEIRAKDGKTLHAEINARPLKEDDEIVGEIGIVRDITEGKRAEEKYTLESNLLNPLIRSWG